MRRGPGPSRSSGLRRTTRLAPSRKPVKKVNRKRKQSEFARCYGSRERVRWMKAQPCIVAAPPHWGGIENAHIETDGMGRKADADKIVPLCRLCHARLHDIGPALFQNAYGLDLAACASETERRWRETL